jgi:hypothetical protein
VDNDSDHNKDEFDEEEIIKLLPKNWSSGGKKYK